MSRVFYARPGKNGLLDGQTLADHLGEVAELARKFSDKFSSGEWGYALGLLHDLGKYQEEFQRKLTGENIKVEHSGIGAVLAAEADNVLLSHVLSPCVLGHHGGLPNRVSKDGLSTLSPLIERLERNKETFNKIKDILPTVQLSNLKCPSWISSPLDLSLWIRFLFSCLVDADRLNSEAFGNPEDAKLRSLCSTFQEFDAVLSTHLNKFSQNTEINKLRKIVLDECNVASRCPKGVFSLTVPTGLGKTLSSMSFALKHAIKHDLERIIVVIPYTSIIDQTSAILESIFGSENVIEHHSNLDLDSKKEDERRKELIQDTWDARIVVTTSVQFLETMFSNRASRCRKLHNVCNSVIIFDEAQLLPVIWRNLLVTSVFSPLVNNYGCSIVLSTATQPAFKTLSKKLPGIKTIKEIITDVPSLYKNVVRVNWHIQKNVKNENECISVETLASKLADYDQVLAVVNSRSAARKLANALQNACGDFVYHLSAAMCPKHRKDVIANIKDDLSVGRSCRVVSTQLIEAGVDIDFPVVYRDACGLDSIIQSAGRCNREGKVERGEVHIVRLGELQPDGSMKDLFPSSLPEMLEARKITFDFLEKDLNDLSVLESFYPAYYSARESTIKGKQIKIEKESYDHNFESIGRMFKVIDTKSVSIIIYGFFEEADKLINEFRKNPENKKLRNKLQKFSVPIYPNEFNALRSTNSIEEIIPDSEIWITKRDSFLYDEFFGLLVKNGQ